MSRFTEITSSVSKSYLKNGGWNAFGSSFSDTSFDGIKLQTGSLNFYLRYRTCNKTYGWYPYVTSKVNDYAGSSGKPAEAVQIQVYNNSGTRIDKGFVIMYRAYAEYRWLDWVSNASPERMQMIQNQFGLDGTLDLTGSNSGLPGDGIPLSRFEIRIFEEDLSVDPGDIPASVTNGVSQSYMVNDVWNALTSSTSSAMHGIRIQTENKPYYLKYRTYNTGYGWYSYVKSNDTSASAYAGSAGKNIEGIQIQVCDNSGTKLSGTFVVMYRVFADGKWLSWVSNAPYDIMQSLQTGANLGGTLDGDSSNAGYTGTGKAITQMDIRVFEYVKAPSNDYPTATGEFSQSYRSGGAWSVLTASSCVSSMDGVKLTTNNSAYYLKYRTFSTQTDWLPYVTSTSKDYAGSSGKAVEAVQIQVYDSNNVKLDKTYVVMYRAYTNGVWLDWVSNASPEKMREIIDRDKLSGGVDTAGAYAGTKGTPLNKLEIRFYPNESATVPAEPAIENLAMSYMVGSSSSWTTFENSVTAAQMDGIKIRTSANKSYYLQYRTFNAGKTDWYSYVKSTINDYAGAAGKAIQRLQIQAYKNDGTKLSSGVIVMYRAYVNGAWLSWVSNANKASMEYVQNKYNLGGSLDTAGSYAGISGKNIGGIEIRVFEETVPVSDSTETTIRTKETGGNGMKIYIDPGHGGRDSGTSSGSCLEKTYNLKISLLLKEYLHKKGFNVKLSREIDIYQSLNDRTNDANTWGAELFLSIHNNAKPNSNIKGTEVYYSDLKNDNSKKYGGAIYQKLSGILSPNAFRTYLEDGADFYHVIRESHMTALLVECAHVSNAEDLLFLNNSNNLDKIAQLITEAVYDTVELKPTPIKTDPNVDLPTNPEYNGNNVKFVTEKDKRIMGGLETQNKQLYNSIKKLSEKYPQSKITFYEANISEEDYVNMEYNHNEPTPKAGSYSNYQEKDTAIIDNRIKTIMEKLSYNYTNAELKLHDGDFYLSTKDGVQHFVALQTYFGSGKELAFLCLGYNENVDYEQSVRDALSGTYFGTINLNDYTKWFVDAGKDAKVSPDYLVNKSITECGAKGTDASALAKGIVVNGQTVYNFFGIGASDGSATSSGAQHAAENGWTSPQKAILGGAHFIGDKYIAVGQDTAYLQRFNIISASEKKIISHQYGSAIDMASANCSEMKKVYDGNNGKGLIFKIPVFKD